MTLGSLADIRTHPRPPFSLFYCLVSETCRFFKYWQCQYCSPVLQQSLASRSSRVAVEFLPHADIQLLVGWCSLKKTRGRVQSTYYYLTGASSGLTLENMTLSFFLLLLHSSITWMWTCKHQATIFFLIYQSCVYNCWITPLWTWFMCFISVLGNNTSPSSLERALWVMLNYKKTSEIVADGIIPAKSMATL